MEKPDDLDVQVKTILESRRGDWQEIVKNSGISHSWLSKFVNGHIPNPGLTTLRKVFAAAERREKVRA